MSTASIDSQGFSLDIALPVNEAWCGDGRTVILTVLPNHRLTLNSESWDLDGLSSRLQEIYHTRAERVVFVKAGEGVSYGEVVAAVAVARPHLNYIALLTPSVQRNAGNCGPQLPVRNRLWKHW